MSLSFLRVALSSCVLTDFRGNFNIFVFFYFIFLGFVDLQYTNFVTFPIFNIFKSLLQNQTHTLRCTLNTTYLLLFPPKMMKSTAPLCTQGDVFERLRDKDPNGWATGRKGDRVGLFPDSYVQLVD